MNIDSRGTMCNRYSTATGAYLGRFDDSQPFSVDSWHKPQALGHYKREHRCYRKMFNLCGRKLFGATRHIDITHRNGCLYVWPGWEGRSDAAFHELCQMQRTIEQSDYWTVAEKHRLLAYLEACSLKMPQLADYKATLC